MVPLVCLFGGHLFSCCTCLRSRVIGVIGLSKGFFAVDGPSSLTGASWRTCWTGMWAIVPGIKNPRVNWYRIAPAVIGPRGSVIANLVMDAVEACSGLTIGSGSCRGRFSIHGGWPPYYVFSYFFLVRRDFSNLGCSGFLDFCSLCICALAVVMTFAVSAE